jgi:hypothetical protein
MDIRLREAAASSGPKESVDQSGAFSDPDGLDVAP